MLKAEIGISTVYYTRGFELISRREGTTASYYVYDGGLSVRALTNETGAVTDTLVFDAFGNETGRTGTTDNPYGFQGEEQDATGLYYLRARYMDPATGTFTTMDTYGGSLSDPMSLHKYLFANSNPVRYSDPSGHFSLVEFELSEAIDQILMSSLNYAIAYIGIIQNSNTSLSDSEKLAGYFAAIGVGMLMPFVFSAIALLPFIGALLVTLVLALALGVGSYFAGKNGHEREAVILGIASGDCVGNAIGLSINRVVQWLNEPQLIHIEGDSSVSSDGCIWDDVNQEIDDFYRENKSATVKYDGLQKPVYRGGNDFTAYPKDIKYNKNTGNVKPSHGISVNVDPKSPNIINNGGAYRVDTIPKGLDIIQRGMKDLGHYEIVPEFEMPFEEYQGLLTKIIYSGPY